MVSWNSLAVSGYRLCYACTEVGLNSSSQTSEDTLLQCRAKVAQIHNHNFFSEHHVGTSKHANKHGKDVSKMLFP